MSASIRRRQATSEPGISATETTDPAGYEVDFAEWGLAQAALIRTGHIAEADLENIAEEIESLGREQFSKLRSSLQVMLVHMLKRDGQPERRSRSWALSIREHRSLIEDTIEMSPSLRRRRSDALERAYRAARLRAADETGLPMSRFPAECPYKLEEVLERSFPWTDE